MLKNHCIIESKKDNDLLKNIYENYTTNKPLNEKLIFDYLREIQTKIKEINNIIRKNNSKYIEYNSKPIIFYLKKIIDIYIEVFLDENLVDDHEIFDSTNILLSNYASFDLINYLKDKIKKNDNNDELKKDLFELINMVKINLQPK